MKKKYIVIQTPAGKELMFTFPLPVVHAQMFEATRQLMGEDTVRYPYRGSTCVGAGFIDGGTCSGRSESLNVGSRGVWDSKLHASGGQS
jgi:hypothetical protein